MPNKATTPMMTAATMIPTMIVMCPPLTAESICPAIMQLMIPYPTIRMAFKMAISFAGQYPIIYRATIWSAPLVRSHCF